MTNQNVESVVDNHLCLGCGTCVAVCPHAAISMVETLGGLLVAKVNESNCNHCGLCVSLCPGIHLDGSLLSPRSDPFRGNVVAAYIGQATDERILRNSTSGGIATSLISNLLDEGQIDAALVTEIPNDGSLHPKCVITSDKEEIYRAQGSKYCPVPLNAVMLENISKQHRRIAIVGLPCHVHGLRNFQCRSEEPVEAEPLVIGLACGRTLSYLVVDHFIVESREARENIVGFHYRSKGWRGWPGDVALQIYSGDIQYLSRKFRYELKEIYCPLGCRLCFDKMNVLSDVVLGDPFGIQEDKKGYSYILARTVRGNEALLSARDAGVLRLQAIDAVSIFDAQHVEKRRLDWTVFTSIWKNVGGLIPDFHINKRWHADTKGIDFKPYRQRIQQSLKLARAQSSSKVMKSAKRKVWLHRLKTLEILKTPARRLKGLLQGKALEKRNRYVEKLVD